ncbi:winged helix-turn-helix domain-containing protein [Halobacteria archaeon AArc-m2/3/4]|uniref:Winged helix-turn-helix domain-containing protein n=1 Tax=Natronoglomus mannanivorans TaxID=2979990 RepID=A0ABT2QEG7_9EURY|nr:winged helix-turn-helix domain-containing protein [Halobacteria archaeon AArc-m2/3/4]
MAVETPPDRPSEPERGGLEEYVETQLFAETIDSLEAQIARKKALADPVRYGLCYLLYERERLPRKQLATATGLNDNGLQHHLRALLDANLVAEAPTPDGADGRLTYYRITTLGIQEIESDVQNIG